MAPSEHEVAVGVVLRLDLVASGTYAKDTGAMDLALDLEARAGLSELIDGLAFKAIATALIRKGIVVSLSPFLA